MTPWVIEASAPGKAILHGEHSVVYGKTGVVVSIDLRTKAVLRGPNPYNRKSFTVSLPDLGRSYDFGVDSLRQFICCHSNLLLDASSTEFDQVSFDALKAQVSAFVENNFPDISDSKAGDGLNALLFLYVAMVYESRRGVEPMHLEVSSTIPIGAGLGSSAAYSVAVAAALYRRLVLNQEPKTETDEMTDETSDGFSSKGSSPERTASDAESATSKSAEDDRARKDICQWAFLAEKIIIRGNPSGIDNSICTYGGLLAFRSGKIESIREQQASLPLRIILVNTKVSRDTRRMVGVVRERLRVMPQVTESILEAMDRIAQQCLDTFDEIEASGEEDIPGPRGGGGAAILDNGYLQKPFDTLENLIDTNHGLLNALGVSHPRLEEVQAISKVNGFHAKLTGAGGGGFAFALVTPAHSQAKVDAILKALKSAQFECWETKIATKGVALSN